MVGGPDSGVWLLGVLPEPGSQKLEFSPSKDSTPISRTQLQFLGLNSSFWDSTLLAGTQLQRGWDSTPT